MAKPKKILTKGEKLVKDRIRKKQKYLELKQNPELYAIHKEKERKRYLLRKAEKKVISIKDRTQREQREQRKKWRRNVKNYLERKEEKKRTDDIPVENLPPISEDDEQNCGYEVEEPDPLEITQNQNIQKEEALPRVRSGPTQSSASLRKMRYRHKHIIRKLREQVQKLRKENKLLRRKLYDLGKRVVTTEDSVEKNICDSLRTDKVDDVKRKLYFCETLTQNLKHGYDSLKKKKKYNFLYNFVHNKDGMKKYKVLKNLPFRLRKKMPQQTLNKLKHDVAIFFEEDANSRVAAGKNEYVKRKGIKKQKRYLTDNLRNLYDKFIKEHYIVSYSSFCKYRPYWIVFPDNKRDTCLCKLHCNVDLLMNALKKGKVLKEGSGTEMIKKLCCDSINDKCVQRKCEICKSKVLEYLEFSNEERIIYYQWIIEKEKYKDRNGMEKLKIVSTKKRYEDNARNVVLKLHNIQEAYIQHCHNIVKQYSAIKHLKENLNCNELLIHIDFSENYAFKYNQEVQSFHFGGSRGQASLHTGIIYYVDGQMQTLVTKSFCTLSENLNHDAGSIWAHLTPILKLAKDLVPFLQTIHFLSDSPSSQYRNRFIFYMITMLKTQVETLEKVTWNYQEAGHGKGAPDGIGAVVKRTADNYVKFGGDVGSFQDFVKIISEKIQNIHFEIISEDEIVRKRWPEKIPAFKGTLKVHQVIWSISLPDKVAFRSLSCFSCQDDIQCSHHHLGYLKYVESPTKISDVDLLHIDASPLVSNICDLDAPEDEMNFEELPVPSPTGYELNNKPVSPVVKTLSNVRFDRQNYTFNTKPSTAFNPNDQSDFMKFIQTRSEDQENNNPEQSTSVNSDEEKSSNKENYDRDLAPEWLAQASVLNQANSRQHEDMHPNSSTSKDIVADCSTAITAKYQHSTENNTLAQKCKKRFMTSVTKQKAKKKKTDMAEKDVTSQELSEFTKDKRPILDGSFFPLSRSPREQDFVVVLFILKKNSVYYIAKILEEVDDDDDESDFFVSFLRIKSRTLQTFCEPVLPDTAGIQAKDIKYILPPPKITGSTRRQTSFSFEVDMSQLNLR